MHETVSLKYLLCTGTRSWRSPTSWVVPGMTTAIPGWPVTCPATSTATPFSRYLAHAHCAVRTVSDLCTCAVISQVNNYFFIQIYRSECAVVSYLIQCCGAGAGGAELILGPGAGAEKNF